MKYERPGIERRVKVQGPVIAGVIPVSPATRTPIWAPHGAPDGAGTDGS